MPYDVRVIRGHEFIRLDAQGELDLDASRRMLLDALWACLGTGIGRVLIDVREATVDMTTAQVCSLAQACANIAAPHSDHRIAVLNRPKDEFDRAALVAGVAEEQGWHIHVYRDFEAALNWLNS